MSDGYSSYKNIEDIEAEIKKIDKFEVRLKGDNTYYDAKTPEQAEKVAKEIVEKEKKAWLEYHDKERNRVENLRKLERNINDYLSILKHDLWELQHEKHCPVKGSLADERMLLKKQMLTDMTRTLKGFLDGKLEAKWCDSWIW